MDFAQVQPQNLEAIFSQNPGVWGMAQDYMARANQGNDLTQQHQQLQNQWDQQSQPFRLQQLQLGNQTSEAQLPGIKADSAMRQRKNSNEELLNPQVLKQLQSKYSADALKQHTDELENVGQLMRQLSQVVPPGPGGAAYIKSILKQHGHEDMWDPNWDKQNLDSGFLSEVLADRGTKIGEMSTKFRNAMALQSDKLDTQEAIAQYKADSAKEASAARDAAANERAAMKQKAVANAKDLYDAAKAGKLDYVKAATGLRLEAYKAQQAGFDEDAKAIMALATEFEQANLNARTAGGAGKLDMSQFKGADGKPFAVQEPKPALGGKAKPGSTPDNPIVLK